MRGAGAIGPTWIPTNAATRYFHLLRSTHKIRRAYTALGFDGKCGRQTVSGAIPAKGSPFFYELCEQRHCARPRRQRLTDFFVTKWGSRKDRETLSR